MTARPHDDLQRLWAVLLEQAARSGHRAEPGESEFDFLARLVGRHSPDRLTPAENLQDQHDSYYACVAAAREKLLRERAAGTEGEKS